MNMTEEFVMHVVAQIRIGIAAVDISLQNLI